MTSEQMATTLLALRDVTSCEEELLALIEAAIRYARIRADWSLIERAERFSIESSRTASHEVLIDACNILSRAMLRAGESNQWRAVLGSDRQFIGDVACQIHCQLGLAAR